MHVNQGVIYVSGCGLIILWVRTMTIRLLRSQNTVVLALMVDHNLRPMYTAFCTVRVFRVFPGQCYPCIDCMSGARLHVIHVRKSANEYNQWSILWRPSQPEEYNGANVPIEGILFKLIQPGNMLGSVSDDLEDPSATAALRK